MIEFIRFLMSQQKRQTAHKYLQKQTISDKLPNEPY